MIAIPYGLQVFLVLLTVSQLVGYNLMDMVFQISVHSDR